MRFIVLKKKTIAIVFAALLVCATLILSFSESGAASVYFGNTLRRVPVYRVATEEKKVALTFDAAWGADKTEGIMNILKEYEADATFFLVGFWMESYADMTKAIAQNGFEIGSHSNTHPHMSRLETADVISELTVSVSKIKGLTDQEVKLFRAPFGEYNDRVIEGAESLGLTTIQWDVDSLDWKNLAAIDIVTRVVSKAKEGSIILFHNNSDHILTDLPAVLTALKDKGFSFVRVSNLIYQDNYYIDNTGEQHRK